jgi:hypothetical protein
MDPGIRVSACRLPAFRCVLKEQMENWRETVKKACSHSIHYTLKAK